MKAQFDYLTQYKDNLLALDNISVEAVASAVVLAEKAFIENGNIELGAFCNGLKQAKPRVRYGRPVSAYWACFKNAPDCTMLGLYEAILFDLQVKHGPLVCDQNPPWGYSEPAGSSVEHTESQATDIFRRWLAMAEGRHPDAMFANDGNLPTTKWTKGYKRPTLAA